MAIGGFNSGFSFFDGFPIVGFSIGGGDPDAAAYIAAAGITDADEVAAINQLFKDLKGNGSTTNNTNVYVDLTAMYPISPTSLAAAAINAVNPSTFDLTLNNFVAGNLTANGLIGDGSTKFANTGIGILNDIAQDDHHYAISIHTQTTSVSSAWNFGANDASNTGPLLLGGPSSVSRYYSYNVSSFGNIAAPAEVIATISRDNSADFDIYNNGTFSSTVTIGSLTPATDRSVYIWARNNNGTAACSDARINFVTLGNALTANQAKDLSDAIAKHRASIQTGVLITDIDVAYYIIKGKITDATEAQAIIDLVAGMKAGTLWGKSYAIHPISPTSLSAAALDLKSTYDITWANTPTHASAGVTFNGSTQYGDTGFNQSVVIGATFSEALTLSRTQSAAGVDYYAGAASAAIPFGITQRNETTTTSAFDRNNGAPITVTDGAGVWTHSRRANNDFEYYKDGVSQGTNTTTATLGAPNANLFYGCFNNNGTPSIFAAYTLSFGVITSGLTDAEALELYNIINAYNTAVR